MDQDFSFRDIVRGTRILRPPKHRLSTFGPTTLSYVLLSELPEAGQCRLREGEVTAQRPKIMTSEQWRERFDGFGDDSKAFQQAIESVYGDAFRALEYNFRNDLRQSSVEHFPLAVVAERVTQIMADEDAPRKALLQGPDQRWAFSVMKFVVDLSMRSFPSNVKELDDRGFFDPEGQRLAKQKRDIERLFAEAQKDRTRVSALADRLREFNLFQTYEDRFFALVHSS